MSTEQTLPMHRETADKVSPEPHIMFKREQRLLLLSMRHSTAALATKSTGTKFSLIESSIGTALRRMQD